MKHILLNFPMPPTANEQLAVYRGRMMKTSKARLFDSMIERYRLKNNKILLGLREDLLKDLENGFLLRVDTYFCFSYERLITKKATIKTIDTNNRIKSTLDAVSKAIGIDDKYFVSGYSEKVIRCKLSSEDHSLIVITPAPPIRTEDQVRQSLIIPPSLK